jgi:heme/copper-type cytochrome/quinol oxidase subunit 2
MRRPGWRDWFGRTGKSGARGELSRARIGIVAAAIVVFAVVAAVIIYSNQSHGGQRVTINVTITGAKTMNPNNLTAHQNDIVTINVASDTSGEVHLHGYDKHFECVAGQTVSQTFTADKTGTFDIEWESTSTGLGQFVVTP